MRESDFGRNNLPVFDPRKGDAVHRADMERSSNNLLKALRTGQGENAFPWAMHQRGFKTGEVPCYQLRTAHARIERRQVRYADVDALYVYREPCPQCGVRADLHAEHGCSRRVAL